MSVGKTILSLDAKKAAMGYNSLADIIANVLRKYCLLCNTTQQEVNYS